MSGSFPAMSSPSEKQFSEKYLEKFIDRKLKDGTCRALSPAEIDILKNNNNFAQDWSDIFVSDTFNPHLVKQCEFSGTIYLAGNDEKYVEFDGMQLTAGLSNSTIISSIIYGNCVIRNVGLLANYIIEERSVLLNIGELYTNADNTFGHGFLKNSRQDERLWLEVANEAGGRSVLPFAGMLVADAYLWATYRDDSRLQERFIQFTDRLYNPEEYTLGRIGEQSALVDNRLIKNAHCGSHCVIKGSTHLENLTIQSNQNEASYIGPGVQLKDGIVGYGNKIEYDVKALQFVTGRNVHLEYGLRLLNTYVGPNSTLACCEVLSNLIYPFHEQHHNNSFLIASLVMGQANIAAGATIGSNHNSRAADGEIVAKRGFWPGLVTNFKHNSKFASFSLIAKGYYYAELNITLPFCLISPTNDMNTIQLFPGFWFKYNMYALARNAWKFSKRDKRKIREQHIETDFLAPDTVEEMFSAIEVLHKALQEAAGRIIPFAEIDTDYNQLDKEIKVFLKDQMNKGKALIIKPAQAIYLYRMMIHFYGARSLLDLLEQFLQGGTSAGEALEKLRLRTIKPDTSWENIGGQLIGQTDLNKLLEEIRSDAIDSWQKVHATYTSIREKYPDQKLNHALYSLLRLSGIKQNELSLLFITKALHKFKNSAKQLLDWVMASRQKDYDNPFRLITFRNSDEMNNVIGKFEDNSFLIDYKKDMEFYMKKVDSILSIIER